MYKGYEDMRITFVRHGTTVSNLLKTYSEDDTPLCEAAYKDLLITKRRLEDFRFQKVFSSPLLRVRQTAKVLGFENPICDNRLKECNFGLFKGKTYEQLEKEYPVELKAWFCDAKNGRPPQGESSFDQFERVSHFLDEISKTATDTLIICHYGTIAMGMAWTLKNFELWSHFVPVNGGITEIETDGKHSSIRRFNY